MKKEEKIITAEDIKKPLNNFNTIIGLAILVFIIRIGYGHLYKTALPVMSEGEHVLQIIETFLFAIAFGNLIGAIIKGLKCIIQVMEQ